MSDDRPTGTRKSSDLPLSRSSADGATCCRRLDDFVRLLDDLRHACPDFLQKRVGFHDEREEMLFNTTVRIKGGNQGRRRERRDVSRRNIYGGGGVQNVVEIRHKSSVYKDAMERTERCCGIV